MTKQQPPVDGLCEECGFNYDTGDLQGTVTLLVRQAAECAMALTKAAAGPDPDVVRLRPQPEVWSAIEYACHVRDVLEVQRQRIAQCLAEDRPVYAPMDRTGRVKEQKYEDQDPTEVGAAVMRFAREFGAAARVLTPPQLGKLGLYNYPVRAPRTLGWIIRHTAHEIQHHRHDIITILAELEPPIVPAPKPVAAVEESAGEAAGEGSGSSPSATAGAASPAPAADGDEQGGRGTDDAPGVRVAGGVDVSASDVRGAETVGERRSAAEQWPADEESEAARTRRLHN